jgi:hypothetical protein
MIIRYIATWAYTSLQTGGLIEKRYSKSRCQEELKSQFTGREDVAQNEINLFLTNHFFGRSGKGAEIREDETGVKVLSHDEITCWPNTERLES